MTLRVNGKETDVDDVWRDESLLNFLRDGLGLIGTRFSCGKGVCGACTVHINGRPVRSCITPLSAVLGTSIGTIEGLIAHDGELHPLQQAWIEERVPQCGYCQSGQIMQAVYLLSENANPSDAEIDSALSGNLCRCGTYDRIRRAVKRAAVTQAEEGLS